MSKSQLAMVLLGLTLVRDVSRAQGGPVPGRDLLLYPVGLVSEAAALPGMLGIGLSNPAAARLAADSTWHVGVASMRTPADVGATAHAAGLSRAWRGRTYSVTFLRAAVDGLVRTDTDPLTVGTNVNYSTTVASLAVTGRAAPSVSYGAAFRVRSGQVDFETRSHASFDAGITAEHLTRVDARLGAATYLWSPLAPDEEGPTLVAAADARIAGADTLRTARAGLAFTGTSRRASEQFLYGSMRHGPWELRGGSVRTSAYGNVTYQARIAVAVHYAGYAVGIAREESPSGLQPSYQVVLSSRWR